MAFSGVGIAADWFGRLDIPPTSPTIDRVVFGGRDNLILRVSVARYGRYGRAAGNRDQSVAGISAVEIWVGRQANA